MAAVSDCFSIGSMVSCTTCFKQSIEGEVMAFDQMTKMLILTILSRFPNETTECTASNSPKLNDIIVVNLALCSDVQVKKEEEKVLEAPQSLNLHRLSTRVRNSCEQKKRWITAVSAGVSPEGQRLYMAISKMINHIQWRGPNIVVFDDVTIKPPYKVEDVNGNPDSKEIKYVRKIVEKFLKDQAEMKEA